MRRFRQQRMDVSASRGIDPLTCSTCLCSTVPPLIHIRKATNLYSVILPSRDLSGDEDLKVLPDNLAGERGGSGGGVCDAGGVCWSSTPELGADCRRAAMRERALCSIASRGLEICSAID